MREQMETTVFWGAGKIGRQVLKFWRYYDICPAYFCDSAEELWGKKIEEVSILSPEQVYGLKGATIYITCRFFDEICQELLQNEIAGERIIRADSVCAPEMLYTISDRIIRDSVQNEFLKWEEGCLIDLSGGMVLGGVERWSYTLAKLFQKWGIEGRYIVPRYRHKTVEDKTISAIYVRSEKEPGREDFLAHCVRSITDSRYGTIICNFPFQIFMAACIIKKERKQDFHIIAIVHNDEEIYYRAYCIWQEYIDECLVISQRMKSILTERGFPTEKIRELYWKIPCEERFSRTYSQKGSTLRIGYAGRLKRTQKRLDLVLDVAEKLKKRGIDFSLELAGIGDYEDTLRAETVRRGLTENVVLKGLIEHENIAQFWKAQDIYLSCSDWEGHSISQSEAMAAGAVPVVTNTSGVEDDIQNGYNGYIVKLRDTDAIVRYIEYLNQNRELLPLMGKRCYARIWKRNQAIDEGEYWRGLLLKDTMSLLKI